MTSARAFLAAIAFVLATVGAAEAQVSPEVNDAHREALAGNFEPATAALAAALEQRDLTRDDLVAIYEARAFVDFANGESDAMRENLALIAALDPDHAFDSNYFPGEVTDVFRDLVGDRGGPLGVEAEAVVLASGEFEVRAEVLEDPGLAREVRVHGRGSGREWATGSRTLRVDPGGAETGEYYAEVIGPGGAVLAHAGREGSPLTVELTAAAEEGGGGVPVWVWIVGGVVLAGIAVTIIAVAATSGGVSDDTQPTGPMVRF